MARMDQEERNMMLLVNHEELGRRVGKNGNDHIVMRRRRIINAVGLNVGAGYADGDCCVRGPRCCGKRWCGIDDCRGRNAVYDLEEERQ